MSETETSLSTIQSPFPRLRDLIEGLKPGASPIDMTIGEPRHGVPSFAADIIAEHWKSFSKYPPINGITELRQAIAVWLTRRYALASGVVDPDRHILPLCGTREGLVSAMTLAAAKKNARGAAVLMPNPFYQAYYAGALTAGCEAVMLPATAASGFLPDLDALDPRLLDRTAAFYIASPANPQGVVATPAYFERLIALARRHEFYVFSDECYSEIYQNEPPASALQVAARTGDLNRVLVFNSLSKRSNAPGLRSGFIAGDAGFLKDYLQYRNVACPQVPIPIQHASVALWSDDAHAAESRALYQAKFAAANEKLSGLPNYYEPAGGMFLWLDLSHLGGGVEAAKTIWKGCGVKVLPGAFLAQPDKRGFNPAGDYVRLALVDPLDVTRDAVDRLASMLL
ncbi:aminotransferase class I and II [Rhodomicrobium vannielii ATCC 17100]|uniref:Aminotransferase class I and II n=1 Tax=Rhodomicrobium vannielii (strain ATCC 17100 / DSM 162 / LMG 4299 / NCIMB 10020 / ATH 3.1.1) TaxID=648757 RepID=E3I392_RHOVT|nr:aminotransferase class I/II-fold pyridoxal phosphate-dependent enzyme [Rhodomicrobium vannielii]ADP71453.1 aminotransferase class I and II [Rhodomicrobium vannielii ATCC 17100]